MEKKRFRFGKALSFAFQFAFRFPKYVLLPVFLYMLLALPLIYFDLQLFSKNPVDTVKILIGLAILSFLMIFITFFLFAGYVRMVSKWYQQNIEPVWKDYTVWDFTLFGKYLAVSLIFGVLVYIGTLMFLIPGILMMTIYFFSEYILIDNQGGVRRAFGRSAELVNGVKWQTFCYYMISSIISSGPLAYLVIRYFFFHQVSLMIPIILLSIVTIFLNFAILQLAYCYLFRDLSTQQDAIDNKAKEVGY
jgi:hypothetical protein